MTNSRATEVYKKMARNFMTPEVLSWEIRGGILKELSRGSGLSGKPLYGVSVWNILGESFEHDGRSDCFDTYNQAYYFYKNIN